MLFQENRMSQDSRESEQPKAVEAGFEQRGENVVTGAPASLGACTSPTTSESEGAAGDGAHIGYLDDEKVIQKPVVLPTPRQTGMLAIVQ